jgi:hypothetical protein
LNTTASTTAAGIMPSNTWTTLRCVFNGPAGTVAVYVNNTLVVTHTGAAYTIGDTDFLTMFENANTSFNLNYAWLWYSAESDGTAPFRVPDKMIYGSPATVNADSWAVSGDFT